MRTRPGIWYGQHHGRGRSTWYTSRSSAASTAPCSVTSRSSEPPSASWRIPDYRGPPRATQFHDLLLMVAQQMARPPVIPAPAGFRFQPVDTGEVAARLTELVLSKSAGLVPDMGEPRAYRSSDLLRAYLRATHRQRLIVTLALPGKAAGAFRAGPNLAPGKATGLRTWEEFLADRVS